MAESEYNEGRQAFLDGKPQKACPYGTHKHAINFGSWERDWHYGWEDAEREKKGSKMSQNHSAEWLRGAVWMANCLGDDREAEFYAHLLAEAEAREAGPNKGHKWELKPSLMPHPYCRVCGVVQRKDGQNSPCKGPTAIGLREASAPTAAEVIADCDDAMRAWLEVGDCMASRNMTRSALALIAKLKEAQNA